MGRVSRSDEATSSHVRLKFEVAGDVYLELARGAMVRAGQGATPASQEEAKWAGAGGGGRAATEVAFKGCPGRGGRLRVWSHRILPPGHITVQYMDPHAAPKGTESWLQSWDERQNSVPGGGWDSVTDVAVGTAPGQRGSPKGMCSPNISPGAHHRAVDGCPHNIGGGAS